MPPGMDAAAAPCQRRTIGVLTSLFPSAVRPREGIFALRRYQGLVARGHRVRVVQPTPRVPWPLGQLFPRRFGDLGQRPARETLAGIGVERPRYLHLNGRAVGNARRFARAGLAALQASGPVDVVVCDYAWPAALAAHPLAAAGTPCIISGRGSDILEVAGEAGLAAPLAAALRAASGYCAVSQDLVDAMDRLSGATRGVLVANGVDTETFHPNAAARTQARAALGWSGGPHVLVVGHLIPRKDPALALAAFAELHATEPSARLHFVGAGPEEAALRAAIAARQLPADLLGERAPAELADLYRAADALLLTSRREGRPNVVLEALASGLPVVATAAGGTAELLAASPFDVVDQRDPHAIAARLRQVLADPPSAAAITASVAPWTWAAGLANLEHLIEGCLQR